MDDGQLNSIDTANAEFTAMDSWPWHVIIVIVGALMSHFKTPTYVLIGNGLVGFFRLRFIDLPPSFNALRVSASFIRQSYQSYYFRTYKSIPMSIDTIGWLWQDRWTQNSNEATTRPCTAFPLTHTRNALNRNSSVNVVAWMNSSLKLKYFCGAFD